MDAKFFDPDRKEDQFDIAIDYHGQWFHQNTPIAREKLARLFSTALHFNNKTDEYWLITPHEQGRINVVDVPYIVIDYEWNDGALTLRTNLDHTIKPDSQNPIYCKDDKPYCIVQNNVPARLNRQVREKLIDIALSQNGYNELEKTLTLKANNHDHLIARS